jgi:hypothetical protein
MDVRTAPDLVLGALGPSCHMAEPWVYHWVPFVLRALGYACILYTHKGS